ncbi:MULTISPECIES: UDP-N-acetylmuramoyl-tripeptide--D-alanyl-D-alanine ligase [Vibrio]|uniref:UDP-N-acetylmuramoyl-tripeptide--D-alanyl-D-alanine ligase n=2 Tax=Vibrio TaxID=662 RepID=A0A7X4LH23_9VIBR|nr:MULTISPECIES: UDP-N-acetylmuramoyl-tripeptide--D-alanyl-D-alanine ligase [Vibrio]MBF9001526.1 UDP-N-acetylmuramoyl-tripeptide--D-alanyl-D-alanine ligase [Vibrio nitrifigilis]MZI91800.1 UDP-N-acetylmuramoyl-tripeptide--D-alanyl-D-alanine ligase [Vibrio eleionomae]
MITMTLSTIAAELNGELIGQDCEIKTVSTDTRYIEGQSLFIALVGERFDAHDFVAQAQENGAAALLVSRKVASSLPQVLVTDTKQALGQLGAYVHQQCATPTIAITGSCGKTTVKEMVASILSEKGKVLFTSGNFNNDIGVPLTLLRSTPEDDYAVIELGANHIGEIQYTVSLVQPDIALVNNVAAAHLEGFGSIDGVKQAKGEIYSGLKAGSCAVVNLDSNGGDRWKATLANKKVKTFSITDHNADFYAQNIRLNEDGRASFTLVTPKQQVPVTLGIIGKHNVANALAATILATEMGASIENVVTGLANITPVKGRVAVSMLTDKIKLIDDSYNASVPAMKAAVDLLGGFPSMRWLILGNMAELGEESLALHRQVGEHAAPFKFEHVLTYGQDTRVISDVCQGKHFDTHEDMILYIKQQLEKYNDQTHTLLIKGALSSSMGKVVAALKEIF